MRKISPTLAFRKILDVTIPDKWLDPDTAVYTFGNGSRTVRFSVEFEGSARTIASIKPASTDEE